MERLSHTKIDKKAYMGNKELVTVVISPQITGLGDWAFAYCSNLQSISVPITLTELGKDVFLGCDKLTQVFLYDGVDFDVVKNQDDESENILSFDVKLQTNNKLAEANNIQNVILSRLWRMCLVEWQNPVWKAKDDSESSPKEQTAAWLNRWDEQCVKYLGQNDAEGFKPFLAGGEEDYGDQTDDYLAYCHAKRMKKVRCIVDRILIQEEYAITDQIKQDYVTYLKEHFNLNGINTEAWDVLCEVEQNVQELVSCYERLGLFQNRNVTEMIMGIPSQAVELKATLMQLKEKNIVWEMFEL